MKYYINLFSPETYEAFTNSDQSISGFRKGQKNTASQIEVGDRLICYVTKLSRFVGVLEVTSEYFVDEKPIFIEEEDPFVVRFKVNPIVWLSFEKSIPIYDNSLWNHLTFTQGEGRSWTAMVRRSLKEMEAEDGELIAQALTKQMESDEGITHPLSESDLKKLSSLKVKIHDDKVVSVTVPENEEEGNLEDTSAKPEIQESIRIQALLAEIGERMGMKIWLPRNDASRCLKVWSPQEGTLLKSLPLNYDDTTLKTIENIDVLWIKRRSIIRAFEVEHTTSIYSGILRMADLMALQPNLSIKAHIVAPEDRKEKVFQEIRRPVFTLLEKGPLSESCSFISYDSVMELSHEKRLEYMKDDVLEEFTEEAEV